MRKLFGLALLILSGFAIPMFGQAQPGDQKPASICFYRPQRAEGWVLKPFVFVDGKEVRRIHNGDTFTISVAPGEHKIHSTDKSTGIDLDALAGETYYVRVDIKIGVTKFLMTTGYGAVTLVDPQNGKYEAGVQAERQKDSH